MGGRGGRSATDVTEAAAVAISKIPADNGVSHGGTWNANLWRVQKWDVFLGVGTWGRGSWKCGAVLNTGDV